jgi:transcriptional regulator with XRE-family HTH domain
MMISGEEAIATRIRARREALHMTQQEVSDNLNVERATYARWENGKISVRASDLKRLAGILKVRVAYFYGDDMEVGGPSVVSDPINDYTYEVTDREMDEMNASIAGVPPEIRPAALAAFKALTKSLAAAKEPKTFGAGKGARTVVDPDIDGIEKSKEE